jgi:hypothetical protein
MLNLAPVPPCRTRVSNLVLRIAKPLPRLVAILGLLALWPNSTRSDGPALGTEVSFIAGSEFPGLDGNIAMADFNGDGLPDLVGLKDNDNNVAVLLNKGNGVFGQAQESTLGGNGPRGLVVGDFNTDGKADVAVANVASNNISVLLGNGDGTFQPAQNFAAGTAPLSIAVGDFNGDGRLDLALVNAGSSGNVSVLLGNGDGTFQSARSFAVGPFPISLAVGDFNGDGKLDLVVPFSPTLLGQGASVLLGNGDGTFQPAQTISIPADCRHVVVGDFNGDGRQDLALPEFTKPVVAVLFGNGDGSFQNPKLVPVPSRGGAVFAAAGDFNEDGLPDLVIGSFDTNVSAVSVLLSKGDGSFTPGQVMGAPYPFSLATGDFNVDGRVDFAVGGSGVSIFFGNGNGSFQAAANYGVGSIPRSIIAADFNGDGNQDLAVANIGSNSTSVLLGRGDGTFQAAANYPAGDSPVGMVVGDFNADGKQDLVTAGGGTISVLLGNGDGTFQAAQTMAVGPNPESLAMGDFDGDGHLDLAVQEGSCSLTILLGRGDGTFSVGQSFTACGHLVAVGDFDGDGRLDLVGGGDCCNAGGPTPLSIFLGNGDGTFQTGQAVAPSGSPVGVGDFDGDGHLDLVVSMLNGLSIFLGNGDGTFRAGQTIANNGGLVVGVADFNRDGRADLVVADDGSVSVLLGNGDGSFQPARSFIADLGAAWPAVADFNGDGLPDIAVSNLSSGFVFNPNDVSILINNSSFSSPEGITPLTIAAQSISRQYGGINSTFGGIYNGFTNGDGPSALTGSLVCSSNTTATSPVGSYPITCSGLSSQKYAITYLPGVLTITPAPLAVTANNASRLYGASNPAFTGSVVGVQNGDNISAAYTTAASSGSPVGAYAITPALVDPTGRLGNYNVTVVNGTLSVTPAPLTIAANNAMSILHGALPSFTASYAAFVNGDGPSALSGSLNCSTNATAASPVGSYVINCAGQSSNNYNIAYKSGTLNIIYEPGGTCAGQPGHAILPPINANGSSVFNLRRTVPAQFRVCDAKGVSIGTPGVVSTFYLTQISSGTSSSSVDATVASTTPDTAFRWDSIGQQWIFNISTTNLASGQTYGFTIALNDGSKIVFGFGLK